MRHLYTGLLGVKQKNTEMYFVLFLVQVAYSVLREGLAMCRHTVICVQLKPRQSGRRYWEGLFFVCWLLNVPTIC